MRDNHRAICTASKWAPKTAASAAKPVAATASKPAASRWKIWLCLSFCLLMMVLRGVRIYQSLNREAEHAAFNRAMQKGLDEQVGKFAKAQWNSQWQAAQKSVEKDSDVILNILKAREARDAASRPATTPTMANATAPTSGGTVR